MDLDVHLIRKFYALLLALITLGFCITCASSAPTAPITAYTDPAYYTSLPFGFYSHWLQPWRAYLETVPATQFLDGIGINFNVGDSHPELIAQMLARHGVRGARIEIAWGDIHYDDETQLNHAAKHARVLQALQAENIRPLILLNAHHGLPVPAIVSQHRLLAPAEQGATQIQLDDTSGLQVGYSGLSNITEYRAAEFLLTEISEHTVTLSQPLPKSLPSTEPVTITTLKYRPFSPPDTQDYQETIAGWLRYVDTVGRFVAETLGTTQSADKGFDMEIWNELSFGSYFLYINSYYEPNLYDYYEDGVWDSIVAATATYADTHPEQFAGVKFGNGFANTVPWVAASQLPPRITAINKHPYTGRKHYPADEDKNLPVNARFEQYAASTFTPEYSALFPEYFATALQTETLVRDMGPLTLDIYGTDHGRYARVIDGQVVPVPVWITEVNISPVEFQPDISTDRAWEVKTKTVARYFCFFLNKGVTQLYLFATEGGDNSLGIVKQAFLDYANSPDAMYPTDDTAYTSPVLTVIHRLVTQFSHQHDLQLRETRSLTVTSVSDTHDHIQFSGTADPGFPPLYDRDVLALLPYQVNASRFVIPYYVMTRDVMRDLVPEEFTVSIQGIRGQQAHVSGYDPVHDAAVPVQIEARAEDTLTLRLMATDYPYLLLIEES